MKNNARSRPAPKFPKRAVVTNGMPYGDKHLHFGHVGGCFIHSDIYARFLRDRIGKENVVYVSGVDCYGSGPEIKFQLLKQNGFTGTIEDFVTENYNKQKEVLDAYGISLSLYAASAFEPAGSRHAEMSRELFNIWYDQGYLRLEEIELFYDQENEIFLNGRQVEGQCPIVGCQSEKGYADECALGHQYAPKELINPKSVVTGKTPTLRPNKNWYFDLERFSGDLKKRHELLKERGISRKFLLSYIEDFLKDPAILISKVDDLENLHAAREKMPIHESNINEEKKSSVLTFKVLKDREIACEILREHGIRFRTGTTLTPFRLTGNVKWGIPVPEKDGVNDQTFWVWPESLWAPMSFVKTYLDINRPGENWEDWWFGSDSRVYQFIGEDNIYFYDIAGMGLFMALNEKAGRDRQANLPVVIPNRHVFFGNSKASSSGKVRPPAAAELLEFYTAEQLRMHFGHMALQNNSVKFFPKAVFKKWFANEEAPKDLGDIEGFDATLAEGNLLTNVFNRLARSCFYSLQQYFNGKLPPNEILAETKDACHNLIDDYEFAMYRFEFSKAVDMLDKFLRDANKVFDAKMKTAKAEDNNNLRAQTLTDAFHMVKTALVLLHPFAPQGTERLQSYLRVGDEIWDWANITEPLNFFINENHEFMFLEPRVDFFLKHPSQLT
jgi:methionyl-tRNA synthetase